MNYSEEKAKEVLEVKRTLQKENQMFKREHAKMKEDNELQERQNKNL